MGDQAEALREAQQFADSAYADVLSKTSKELQDSLGIQRSRLAAQGIVRSSAMSRGTAQLYGKHIDDLVQARLNGLLEGYELHGVPLDEQLAANATREVMNLKSTLLLSAHKVVTNVDMGLATPEQFAQLVQGECRISRASVDVQVERRRLSPKKESSVTNVYHVHGHNPRWNVNSTDNSVNVVTISSEQVFSNLRQELTSRVTASDELKDILEKLALLEKAQASPSFASRYSEFISASANHMTLIAPFIPALTEMLHKAL